MIEVKGKAGVVARVIADSISPQGIRLTTWEAEYPRLVHADLMSHRMFSRNAASSRAIPFNKMVEQLRGMPVRFGANRSGMQDKGENFISDQLGYYGKTENGDDVWFKLTPEAAWLRAKQDSITHSSRFYNAGYHKQVFNRLVEPFQMMKTIITTTEVANFFWLRDDEAADPSIAELARCMKEAYEQSKPELLQPGEYHLPYIHIAAGKFGERACYLSERESKPIDQWEAIKVSCARCAAVSYRNEGYGLEKSLEVYERLLGSDKKHASAFEHVATPMKETDIGIRFDGYNRPVKDFSKSVNIPAEPVTWERGISHTDRERNLWSGNFKGWVQYRKTIDGENYTGSI